MRSRVMRRRMHRVLWKKLSRIYAVDMAEVLGWIEYMKTKNYTARTMACIMSQTSRIIRL